MGICSQIISKANKGNRNNNTYPNYNNPNNQYNQVNTNRIKPLNQPLQSQSQPQNSLRTDYSSNIIKVSPGEQFFINEDEEQKLDNTFQKEKIEMYISLNNLPEQDINSLYQIKVTICHDAHHQEFIHIGFTEDLRINNLKGQFNTKFVFDFLFDKRQLLRFDITKNSQFYASEIIEVGKIMGSNQQYTLLPIRNSTSQLSICPIRKAMQGNSLNMSSFTISANLNVINNSNDTVPLFYILSHKKSINDWMMIYKSNEYSVIPNIQSMLNQFNITTDSLYSYHNDISQQFKIELIKINIINDTKTMFKLGSGYFSINDLKANACKNQWTTIEIKHSSGINNGSVIINYNESERMSFVEYLKYGMEINLLIAIDYSSPTNHCNNKYEEAIQSCGSILGYYDYDQQYPLFGFGGLLPESTSSSGIQSQCHCFNVNRKKNPCVAGMDQVIDFYKQSLPYITMIQQTHYAPMIRKIMARIKEFKTSNIESKYFVLMVLTEGRIDDFNETCDLLVEASTYPLSLVIVGIGDGNFKEMIQMDGDDKVLTNSKGEKRKRDLVNFVHYEKYRNNIDGLSKKLCEEIPRQVEKYYEMTKSFIKKDIVNKLL